MKQLYALPLLVLSTLALTACPSDIKKSKAPSETFVTVLGDPIKIIGNAQTNSDFSTSDFKDGETLSIMSYVTFEEKKAYVPHDPQKILEKNKTSGREKQSSSGPAADRFLYHIKVLSSDQIQFINADHSFKMSKKDGRSILKTKDNHFYQLVHFSISEDKKTISLLIYSKHHETGLRALTAMYFSRASKNNLNRTDKPYEYISGTGVKLVWPKTKPVQLSLCNSDSEMQRTFATNGINQWKTALGNSLAVDYQGPTQQYPPFSDLNFRCIYIVDTYVSEPDPSLANNGKTSVVPNIEKSEIGDADIMIFKTELKKFNVDENHHYYAKDLEWTMLHELGHFFGLGHQFNGTKSIMSYDNESVTAIERHDVEAIQELYK